MTILYGMSEFSGTLLALAFSFACALLIAFAFLKFLVGFVTREQYNVTDAPRGLRALAWILDAHAAERAAGAPNSLAISNSDIATPAAQLDGLARSAESVGPSANRVV